ncbi:hypothetical protein K7X08_003951 [Anisodus acutangulus]|uniref:Wbp11/ELF5/Saf1 N-terminal domain-containing protein n=1 Tax=Anisodus acutangulus TaxID=402998 RepID=A0A9Q1MJR9_9SOLA|nr:hypothetical protein K7X08_003951 [Anisodus acutangulus]
MKTTKGGKVMNPTDAYRKEIRKRELKRNKKERKKVREVGILKKDPDQLKDQIDKLEVMKAEGALDKARKHKKRQLEDTLNLVLKKRKEYESKMKEKGEEPVMFSHLGPPRRRSAAEEEEMVKHPKPEDSVYYHPTLNPTGAPPPGKPPMFKSSIGPRIPLSAASSSGAASSSKSDVEDGTLSALPPPPPPPPLPPTGDTDSADGSAVPASLPLPPPPPMPPKPAVTDMDASLPLPPLPPPPPGPPPKEHISGHHPLPPPPPRPLHQSAQPPLSGTGRNERDKNHSELDEMASTEQNQVSSMLPPPPPPPGLPFKSGGMPAESDAKALETKDHLKLPPPPPRQQPSGPGPAMVPTLQPDVLPPGISRFPPPPPPTDMRPPPGISIQPAPPGMMVPLMARPPFGPPGGPQLMMRPPLPPGPPPFQQDGGRLLAPQKPSYVKSAASTVVKRPLAQHTPELTSMVPASVRVRRESALPKPKPKSSTAVTVNQPAVTPRVVKHESTSASVPKPQSIDDSYTAFLEDMKALGALEG